jgi:hypothetical protein
MNTSDDVYLRSTPDGRVPMPGDAVRLMGKYIGETDGSIAIIEGRIGQAEAKYRICFRANAFRGRSSPHTCGHEFVSCSGGPLPVVASTDLKPTDETVSVTCWRWGEKGPGAHCGHYFKLDVPVWEWSPNPKRIPPRL